MGNLVLFMHVSLDGYVAGPGGEMDWIHVDKEIFDYVGNRTNQSDTALYGRVTWQMMDAYWPTADKKPGASEHDRQHASWYRKANKLVLSRTMKNESREKTRFISENVAEEINKVKAASGNEILIFGSPTAFHSLFADNLVDEFWLFINPIIIGNGISLFKNVNERKKLELIKSSPFKSGVVCLHYKLKPNEK